MVAAIDDLGASTGLQRECVRLRAVRELTR